MSHRSLKLTSSVMSSHESPADGNLNRQLTELNPAISPVAGSRLWSRIGGAGTPSELKDDDSCGMLDQSRGRGCSEHISFPVLEEKLTARNPQWVAGSVLRLRLDPQG
jgi:hypothetical protein